MGEWLLANPFGIQRDDAGDIWHAGHVNDVLQIDNDTIVVAADRGGVWRLTSMGDGAALSHDWDNPDVLSLAFGPAGSHHIFAASGEFKGKGALWVTDPMAAEPLAAWHKIPIPDTGGVTRILVLPGVSRVVISAQRGLWWSPLPSAADPFAYQWTQATASLPGWTEIAEGPGESVVAAIPGSGLFFGAWVAGDLRIRPANAPGINPGDFGRTSIASCAANRQILYAVVEKDGNLFAVLSSGSGGQTWQILATQVVGQPPGTALTSPNQAGDNGSYNNCIAVSPANPAVVAIGWRIGLFLSQNSGATWKKFDVVNQSPFHADLHAVYFAPPDGGRLFIGSDGGIMAADVVLGPPPDLQNFVTVFNKHLANLQFGGWSPLRSAWASFSVNDAFAAGGLQDNGNVYTRWTDQSPWRQAADSDGQLTLLVTDMGLLYDNTGDRFLPTLATWDGAKMVERGAPDVRKDDGTIVPNIHKDPNAVEGLGAPKDLIVEAVRAPKLQSQDNPEFRIRAVAGVGNRVHGLFDDNHTATRMHWEHWNQLGPLLLDANDFITAVGSYDGQIIFAGTNFGRIFWIDPTNGIQAAMDSGNAAQVTRILIDASGPPTITGFASAGSMVLQLINGSTQGPGGRWNLLGPVTAAADTVIDIAMGAHLPSLYAATNARVFTSCDGHTWYDASLGLPEVPHCAGLQVAGGNVFLGTFGRSMWFADFDSGNGFRISGQVTDTNLNPIPGATVRVMQIDPGIVPGIITAMTDSTGSYSICFYAGSYVGQYSVDVWASGFEDMGIVQDKIDNGAIITKNFSLGRIGVLQGTVTDTNARPTPLAGAGVLVGEGVPVVGQPNTFKFSTQTDSAGNYMIMIEPHGAYKAVAFHSGFNDSPPFDITINVDENRTLNFALSMAMTGNITGMVQDADSGDVLDATVVATGVDPPSGSVMTETDGDGIYTLSNLLSGRYQVAAGAKGYHEDNAMVKVIPGQTASASFELVPKRRPKPSEPA